MINVAALWRHPIKSHGREEIKTVTLVAGQTMPWDRHWAVTHNASKINANNPAWVICRNFMIGASTPGLAGIWAELDTETATVTLRHDMLGHFTFRPDDAADLAAGIISVEQAVQTFDLLENGFSGLASVGFICACYQNLKSCCHCRRS